MRVLVTGASGFVGRHVVRELLAHAHEVSALDQQPCDLLPAGAVHQADLCDAGAVRRVVADVRPDACLHLAGIAFVPRGWTEPNLVFEVNVGGTLHLLEALRHEAPQARMLSVTSAEVYGREPREEALDEASSLEPSNLYAVSKIAADRATLLYHRRYGLHTMTARPQNHVGPGQSTAFVVTSFAHQVAAIRQGEQEPLLRVGNLESKRDFTDVRDVARAYRLLLEKGHPGEAYNIASGHPVPIRWLLDHLCEMAGIQPTIEVDMERFRPSDHPPLLDTAKIRRHVGWDVRIPLQDTLREVLKETGAA